jgi:hypothetical protein
LANLKLPDPLSRRHLLEGGLDSTKALALAMAYLEDGRDIEAIDFLSAIDLDSSTEARQLLESLQSAALDRGDVFLMRAASAALDDEPSAETWRSLAAAALRADRAQDVETAERLATVGAE